MSERDNFQLKGVSYAVLSLIAVTIGLLYIDTLTLATFKRVMIVLLFIAVILLFLLQRSVKTAIQKAKLWTGGSTDIHDQQEQFKQLAESEIYFRTMADDSPFMIWKSDKEGKCIYVNNRWIRVTGLAFEESLGFGYSQVMDTTTEEEKKNWLEAVSKQLPYHTKFRLKQANNELRWVIAQSNPYYLDGEFAGYIGSIADITDQELAAQALKELSDKKDEFISIASHELKTPLTSVRGFTQILLKNLDRDSKAYGFGIKIQQHSDRLENLITNLLDVSKINAGRLIYQKSLFTLESLINESVENVQYIESDHQITSEPVPDINIYGDKFRLEQVINNLLINAMKYSPAGSEIIITAQLLDKHVKVSIEDKGIGISEENIGKLFERFQRIDTSMRYQGLGLGLYISAEIIKQHKGEIGVNSVVEKGSTFWFTLPLEIKNAID